MTTLGFVTNEAGIATDYASTTTTGGTVTESGSFFRKGKGANALRVNKTSNADVYADQRYVGSAVGLTCSGAFWFYVAALPSALTGFFCARYVTANNMLLTIDQNGDIRIKEQGGSSSNVLGRAAVGTEYMMEWRNDSSGNPHIFYARFNGLGSAIFTAGAAAAENIANVSYGQRSDTGNTTGTGLDIYYDDQAIYDDLAWHGLQSWQPAGFNTVGASRLTGVTALTDTPRTFGEIR